jgi:hypothetical protein
LQITKPTKTPKKNQYKEQKYNNIQTDIIVMDFAKAFGKVPHKNVIC